MAFVRLGDVVLCPPRDRPWKQQNVGVMVVAADSAVIVRDRLHAALLAYSGLAGIEYWVQWFTDESARTSGDPAYLEHNRSFVLADAYLAGAALLAVRQLWKGHPSAVPLGVATGSAMTFLGLLDLLYDLQHGTFSDRTSAARLEASIVGSALVLGPTTMARLWKARARLAA